MCGYPCSVWLSITLLSYQGGTFHGWPDGGSLVDQEFCVVEILREMYAELMKEVKSGE